MVAEPRSEREAVYGRFVGAPSRAELERFFFLDDADQRLIAKRRGDRNRVGFALRLGTLRFLGMFLADPTDVPREVIAYVAEQVGARDASCLDGYLGRRATRFEHTAEIVAAYGYRDFAAAETELVQWLDDRAWTTGEGPTALFVGAVGWLRERLVLLPGLTTLRRLVGGVRDEVTQRLWDVLAALVSREQARRLERLLVVADGSRVSDLERMRTGPTTISGKSMVAALERVAELAGLGFGSLDLSGVPARRVVELARWGMAGKAPALRRHPEGAPAGDASGDRRVPRGEGDRRRLRVARRWPDGHPMSVVCLGLRSRSQNALLSRQLFGRRGSRQGREPDAELD